MSSNNNSNKQLVCIAAAATTITPPDCLPQQRRIEFHLARKPSSSLPIISPNFKLETLNPSSSSSTISQPFSSSSNPSKKSDSSDLFDGGFDIDFGFRIPFRRIGAGLENLGNTCFLNSVIQCLTYTEPLVAYLQSGKHQNTCHVAGFCALCAIQKHVNCALQSTGRILAPKDLVSNLRCISRSFRNARQEDAHEYMINLLESMHKCCLPSGVPAESPGAYEKSLVHKIFGGRLRSQVKCLQCSHCSNTFDPFLDLSLEIMKADSVYKALMHFTAAEQLDGGERQYKCERCKQKVKALKQLTVYKAPYVLTIHLKRFRHFAGQKIDKKVHFGSSLNLKPFVSGAYEGDLTYTLYGVLVHAGWSTHSGHYYCFVRTSTGLWYSLDDNRVYQVSEKTVMEQKAYMLFYVRDRKNVGPKKAVDVHKENLITTIRNASSSCSISGAKSLQNGYVDKNSKEAISSGLLVKHSESRNVSDVLVQQNTSKFVVSNNVSSKKELNQNSHCRISSESPSLIKENATLANSDGDGKLDSTTMLNNNDHSTSAARCDNNEEKGLISSEKQLISNCPSSVTNSHMVITSAGTNLRNFLSNDVNDGLTKTDLSSDSVTQSTITDGNVKLKVEDMEPMMSDACAVVSKPKTKRLSTNVLSLVNSPESTPRQRLIKEIFKSRVVGTHLSTKMLYGASFMLRNRKRFKRIKRSKTVELTPADMGPSTSDSSSIGSFNYSHKKSCNSSVREKGACSESSCSQEAKFKETSSLASGPCSKEPHSQLKNDVSNTGTRRFEESAVGRWEGTESVLKRGEFNTQETVSIGHVLDEWDEEYDRGKRKKVRALRNSFGGPNAFQEVATKKAKLKVKKD